VDTVYIRNHGRAYGACYIFWYQISRRSAAWLQGGPQQAVSTARS